MGTTTSLPRQHSDMCTHQHGKNWSQQSGLNRQRLCESPWLCVGVVVANRRDTVNDVSQIPRRLECLVGIGVKAVQSGDK